MLDVQTDILRAASHRAEDDHLPLLALELLRGAHRHVCHVLLLQPPLQLLNLSSVGCDDTNIIFINTKLDKVLYVVNNSVDLFWIEEAWGVTFSAILRIYLV